MSDTATKHITYTLSVTITRPLSDDPDDPDYPTVEGATDRTELRHIERCVLRALRPIEGDCDAEIISHEVEED